MTALFTIDKTLCVNCGACVRTCPMSLFYKSENGSVAVRDGRCLDCFHCTAVCPTEALTHDRLGKDTCLPLPADGDSLLARLQRRRSIRHFKPETPDRAVIQAALDGAEYGPSAKNDRAFQWTVILGRDAVERLRGIILDWAAVTPGYRHLARLARQGADPLTCGAPCLILVHCPDSSKLPAVDSVIAATLAEQLLNDAGLGTCWGGYLHRAADLCLPFREAIALPEGHQVHAVLMAGYSDEVYRRIPVRPGAKVNWLE